MIEAAKIVSNQTRFSTHKTLKERKIGRSENKNLKIRRFSKKILNVKAYVTITCTMDYLSA